MNAQGNPRPGGGASTAGSAFARYVVPEIPALLGVARGLCRNPHDAEDVVQETLLRAYRAIDRFDGAHPRAWLFTILRNANLNRVRKPLPASLTEASDAAEIASGDDADPSSVVEARAFRDEVRRSMDRLPEERRRLMEIVDIHGLSYADAAAALGIPMGTVMSRLHRARRDVRQDLQRAGLAPVKGRMS